MCRQCLTESTMVINNIIPGFSIVKAQKDHEDWKKGQYAIVSCNDPDFLIVGDLIKDPEWGMSDEAIEKESKNEEFNKKCDDFLGWAELNQMQCAPSRGYSMVHAAIQKGFDPEESGEFHYWFLGFIALRILG